MGVVYRTLLFDNNIVESNDQRLIEIGDGYFLNIPGRTNNIRVPRPTKERRGSLEIYYRRKLDSTDGPIVGFGHDTIPSGLGETLLKELKKIKSN